MNAVASRRITRVTPNDKIKELREQINEWDRHIARIEDMKEEAFKRIDSLSEQE